MALYIIFFCASEVERDVELVLPSKLETGFAHSIVAHLCTGMSLGKVGCMCRNLIGNHTFTHIFEIWQCQVLLRSNVAYHGSAEPCYLSSTYSRSNVVVGGSNIGGQRAECVERGFVARFDLALHIFLDFVHWHVTRTFDNHLHIVSPSLLGQFAEHIKFEELSTVVGIVDATGTHTVAKRNCHIVLTEDIAYLIEVSVEETFLIVQHAPFGHNATATRNAACETTLE